MRRPARSQALNKASVYTDESIGTPIVRCKKTSFVQMPKNPSAAGCVPVRRGFHLFSILLFFYDVLP